MTTTATEQAANLTARIFQFPKRRKPGRKAKPKTGALSATVYQFPSRPALPKPIINRLFAIWSEAESLQNQIPTDTHPGIWRDLELCKKAVEFALEELGELEGARS